MSLIRNEVGYLFIFFGYVVNCVFVHFPFEAVVPFLVRSFIYLMDKKNFFALHILKRVLGNFIKDWNWAKDITGCFQVNSEYRLESKGYQILYLFDCF